MGTFECYLSLWVALCIVVGILLATAVPGVFAAIASAEVAQVNLIVAALIWLMIVLVEVPVMLSVVAIVKRSRPWYERNLVS
ncbi:ACR3 family arsenite efflux pump ArsB [Sphingobium sp. B2D3A]|uniref:hypothetical protein n=1 Tax=Sphingobium TaxID=165695 RepID=UPI0017E6ECD1|nr:MULTISPECIES: hypothetical protein [Sphingobium]MCW2337913.1 ACR3 family arsenite efflux pump ArsB [Sphingobium sp. B2D3A]MCW2361874.1 ACR3 family arsenite efflux pump ArsB [Sphingobium sp. B10D3B]MCW2384372.1 ACR3 family arsenite efflux pump ArsB [Sphingobium sp. B2D3D]MCW2401447.1 ACR3 family arsenite efflux pump ArsB [Sphingobium sp. B10D7B]MCW2408427.1 ACR3 family arsenite efflux pump ArsB [Sphingobium xanthum]